MWLHIHSNSTTLKSIIILQKQAWELTSKRIRSPSSCCPARSTYWTSPESLRWEDIKDLCKQHTHKCSPQCHQTLAHCMWGRGEGEKDEEEVEVSREVIDQLVESLLMINDRCWGNIPTHQSISKHGGKHLFNVHNTVYAVCGGGNVALKTGNNAFQPREVHNLITSC